MTVPLSSPNVSTSDMDTLLSSSLHNPGLLTKFHIPRFEQRLAIVRTWGVREKERILDIGCGQGESCLALALQVGKLGHVTGIDPAQLDYGHPFTMREAHEHIKTSVLGPRITFYPVDTPSFLANLDVKPHTILDSAALCHSLWYFPNHDVAHSLFATLAQANIARLYLAEWSYTPSQESQVPHVLAAKAQALLYRYKAPREPGLREQNVRAGPDQQPIIKVANDAGFHVIKESLIPPVEGMQEGHLEVGYVLGELFQQRMAEGNLSDDQEAEIHALIQQLRSETERLESMGVTMWRSMDVWCAVLELKQ
ncbi:Methyltransferase ustM [Cladobotryum mycophilum]|uniref:Methyltransferase ustM n=1 Tax=Cladobotryum mycophilum TaxID=491253 RepID=A0ABR0SWP1_9HYPO